MRTRTRGLAQDGTVLAQARAGGGGPAVGPRTAGRCAALGSTGDVHGRADLRSGRDDMREAVGERAADQPLEPGEIADEAMRRGLIPNVSQRSVGRFLKKRPTSSRIASAIG
jgi:hypothetical protein